MWLKAKPDEDMGQLYSWFLYFFRSKKKRQELSKRQVTPRNGLYIIMMGGAPRVPYPPSCLKGVIPLAATGIAI